MIDIFKQDGSNLSCRLFLWRLWRFCFSMTIGVLWEFFEFGMDTMTKNGYAKDYLLHYGSVFKPGKRKTPAVIKDDKKTVIDGTVDGKKPLKVTIDGGYLDMRHSRYHEGPLLAKFHRRPHIFRFSVFLHHQKQGQKTAFVAVYSKTKTIARHSSTGVTSFFRVRIMSTKSSGLSKR